MTSLAAEATELRFAPSPHVRVKANEIEKGGL